MKSALQSMWVILSDPRFWILGGLSSLSVSFSEEPSEKHEEPDIVIQCRFKFTRFCASMAGVLLLLNFLNDEPSE